MKQPKPTVKIAALPAKKGLSIDWIKLLFVAIGFSAIGALAMHIMELVPLHRSAPLLVIPGFFFLVGVGIKYPAVGRLALKGWVAGVIAVTLYDLSRIPFILAGWNDFIPKIGDWALNAEGTHAVVGYAWRYIGNGGGMGIAFIVLMSMMNIKGKKVLAGLIYGLFVFLCLDITLLVAPNGSQMMFEITPLIFTGSLIGHVVYGLVLGAMVQRFTRSMALPTSC